MKSRIRVGTRGSALALYQAEVVKCAIERTLPLIQCELVKIRTKGDMMRRGRVQTVGRGIFTRELEEALLSGEIDLAVHSAKDLESHLPAGLRLGAVLEREDERDCLVARGGRTLGALETKARLGTSSLRRRAQILKLRPDLEVSDMRGNIDTRLKKIESGAYDGMVVALAGLKRLGFVNVVTEVFDRERFLPQAGQGVIAVEVREGDRELGELLSALNHKATAECLLAERSFLRKLEGGCQIPAGVSSEIAGDRLVLKGAVFSIDGGREVRAEEKSPATECEQAGARLAETILDKGGRELLNEIRKVEKV